MMFVVTKGALLNKEPLCGVIDFYLVGTDISYRSTNG